MKFYEFLLHVSRNSRYRMVYEPMGIEERNPHTGNLINILVNLLVLLLCYIEILQTVVQGPKTNIFQKEAESTFFLSQK